MENNKLVEDLKKFLEPIKIDESQGKAQILTPKKEYEILLWFEGGFTIGGKHDKITFGYDGVKNGMLVIGHGKNRDRVLRIPISRMIGFELMPVSKGGIKSTVVYEN